MKGIAKKIIANKLIENPIIKNMANITEKDIIEILRPIVCKDCEAVERFARAIIDKIKEDEDCSSCDIWREAKNLRPIH